MRPEKKQNKIKIYDLRKYKIEFENYLFWCCRSVPGVVDQ